MSAPPLLEVKSLQVRFGGVLALDDVHMKVDRNAVHGLIGPNGAGKTTLLNCIAGLIQPQKGQIRFRDHDLIGMAPYSIVDLGMARTFQNFGLIEDLPVLDNVIAGLHSRNPCTLLDEILLFHRRSAAERAMRQLAVEALESVGLAHLMDAPVRSLSYGKRKAVELARAVAVQPQLLLLDEPTAGLSEAEMQDLSATMVALRQRTDTTLVIISHHMEFLLAIADRVTVLNLGRLIAEGSPQEIQGDPAVISAYLGSED